MEQIIIGVPVFMLAFYLTYNTFKDENKSKNFWDTNKNPITMEVVKQYKEDCFIKNNKSRKLDFNEARSKNRWI